MGGASPTQPWGDPDGRPTPDGECSGIGKSGQALRAPPLAAAASSPPGIGVGSGSEVGSPLTTGGAVALTTGGAVALTTGGAVVTTGGAVAP